MLCLSVFAGCSREFTASVDGTPVRDLHAAAALARVGSTIRLEPGLHLGGVTLPDGVVVSGRDAVITAETPVLVGLGALTLTGITLGAGPPEEGGVVQNAGALTLEGVTLRASDGDARLRPAGDLFVRDSSLQGAGVLVRTGDARGRPSQVELTDSVGSGILEVPGDRVDISGLTGAADLRVSGQGLLIQDSVLGALEARSPGIQLAGLTVDRSAFLYGDEGLLLDLTGGTWQAEVRELTASGWHADAVVVQSDRAVLADLSASLLIVDAGFASLAGIRAIETDVGAESLTATDIAGTRVSLQGLGVADQVVVDGPNATLSLGPMFVDGVVVRSTEGPARLALFGTQLDGAVVIEPEDAVDPGPALDIVSYAFVEHLTWRGGSRGRLSPEDASLYVSDSLFTARSFGLVLEVGFLTSVLWEIDGTLGPVPQAIVDDPKFQAPEAPFLLPESLYLDRGGLAGPSGPVVGALWDGLP